jgi:phosphoribosyl-ATP pyrophosphohydrolase/phosphoribosyl-AMP cyclohydrolase/histidinol dehydrogenase
MGLRRITPRELPSGRRDPVDADTLAAAARIVTDVRDVGEAALRRYAERFGDLTVGAPLVFGPDVLAAARDALPATDRALLERTADRIRAFATSQRSAIQEIDVAVPGGRAGHTVSPVDRAGCYAPGGRFPLPSSVLMTAVTARAAGVAEVIVASPRPAHVTLAAAAIAGADALVPLGGAHTIAALAYGCGPIPAVDVIVGPGNRWVTAAKQLIVGRTAIDMLAGPSELVVLADDSADPETIAADLLAQAEHDPDARPILVTTSTTLADAVDAALDRALACLPTADTATPACAGGFTVLCASLDEAVGVCDLIAPEHLEVITHDADAVAARLRHYGGLFIGGASAEVLGDYGVGPNHVLPTGSTARFTGGLSVLHFLRVRTWLRMEEGDALQQVARDAAQLARLEGLEGHARSAERRIVASTKLKPSS